MKAKFITFVRGLMNGTPPRFQSYLKSLTLLLAMLMSVNVWGAEYEELYKSGSFTTVSNHGYTQNKTFTLADKTWKSSISQVNSSVFYLGCNSNNAAKGVLNDNSDFSEIVTALAAVDSKFNDSKTTAHAYALLFNNEYDKVTKVTFNWSGGNNAFQVYLFGYTNSKWVNLGYTNYATSGTSVAGSVEWTGDATKYTKFAIATRPGTTTTTATNKTIRPEEFIIYKNKAAAVAHTVTFEADSHGTCSTTSLTEGSAGAGVTLPNVTANDGWKFLGWATTSGATTADAGVAGATYKPSKDITLYAVYKQLYKVTLWRNGSSTTTGWIEEDSYTLPTMAQETAACEEWPFKGWSTSIVPSTTTTPSFETTASKDSKTFYAVYGKAEGDPTPVTTTYTLNGNWTTDNGNWSKEVGSADIVSANSKWGLTNNGTTTGISPSSYSGISKIEIVTSKSGSGAGTASVQYGSSTQWTNVLSSSNSKNIGSTLSWTPTQPLDGYLRVSFTRTNGYIYITSIAITYSASTTTYTTSPDCAEKYSISSNITGQGSILWSLDGETFGETIAKQPENTGIYFKLVPTSGWEIDGKPSLSTGGEVTDMEYDNIYGFEMPASAVTVSATFKQPATYMILYDLGNFTDATGDLPDPEEVAPGTNYSVNTTNKLSLTGYTFKGWNTDKNATTGLTNITVNDDITLYAIFTINSYNVTFTPSITGGSIKVNGSSTSPVQVQYNKDVTIIVTPTTHFNLSTLTYNSTDIKTAKSFKMPAENVEIVYSFTEDPKVTVTFKNNGETLTTDGTREVYVNDPIGTLPTLTSADAKDAFSKTFVGWTEEEVTTWQDQAPAPITSTKVVEKELTLNAVWAKETEGTGYTNNYQKITSTSDLTSGDYIFMAYEDYYSTDYYWALDKTTYQTNFLTATSVKDKLSDNKEQILNNTDNDIVWTIAFKNNDNSKISIMNGSNYLNMIQYKEYRNLKCSFTSDYFTYSVNNGLWKFVSENQSGYKVYYNASDTKFGTIEENASVEGQLYLYKRIHDIAYTDYITHSSASPLASITLNTTDVKTNYFEGETFTSAGLTATATLGDGITFPIEYETLNISTPDLTTAGEKTVTVRYTFNNQEQSAEYKVNAYSVTVNKVMKHQVDGDNVDGNTYNWNEQTHALTFTKQAHYQFNGITNVVGADKTGSNLSYTLSNPTANVTLTAEWQRLFTLQYNSKGGAAVSSVVDVTKNTTVETKPTPNYTGYNLVGWFDNESCTGEAVTFPYAITKDETLFAKWEVKTTEITLSQTDATTKGTEQVTATWGQPMPTTDVTMPQREHYQFAGYKHSNTLYYNADGSSAKDWDKEDAEATLTAQWNINKHNIILPAVLAGGSLSFSTGTSDVSYNATVTITPHPNAHYTLTALSWNDHNILSTKSFQMPDEDVTIEATFTEDPKRTINWSVGGQIASTTADVYDGTAFSALNPPTVGDNAAGDCADKFMGWAIAPINTQGGIDKDAVQWADEATTSETQNTFYAVFAKGETTSTTKETTYSYEFTSKQWSDTGDKTLDGITWTMEDNGGYYGYDNTKGHQFGSSGNPAKALTISTSDFVGKVKSVEVYTSGAGSVTANVSITVGGASYLSATSITASNSPYSGTGTSSGEIKISWSQTSSKALYVKSIEVIYDKTESKTVYSNYITQCCTTPEHPLEITNTDLTVKAGGTLQLNTTDGNGATKVWASLNGAVATVEQDGKVTPVTTGKATITVSQAATNGFCAQYDEVEIEVIAANEFGISFTAAEGGSTVAKVNDTPTNKATTGTTVTITATPDDDYNFTGWTVNAGGVTLADASLATTTFTMGEADVEITPSFALKQFTVTLNAGNGTIEGGSTKELKNQDIHSTITLPDAVACNSDEWEFKGWATASVTETAIEPTFVSSTEYEVTDNAILYAVYGQTTTVDGDYKYKIYAQVGETRKYMKGEPIIPSGSSKINTIEVGTEAQAQIYTLVTIDASANKYALKYTVDATSKYLYINKEGSGNNANYYLQSTTSLNNTAYWTKSTGTKGSVRLTNVQYYDYGIIYRGGSYNYVKAFKTSNVTTNGEYYDLELQIVGREQTEGGVWNSNPSCTHHYQVTYDGNGATTTCTSEKLEEGEITLCADAPVKAGYEFAGWNDGTTTYAAGAKYNLTAPVTFTAVWNPIKVTAITLNVTEPQTLNWKSDLASAPTFQLSVASTTPAAVADNSVTWSVSEGTAVSVSATGLVTAVETGTATITATANDGSNVKASCTFTVTKTYKLTITDTEGVYNIKANGSTTKNQYVEAATEITLVGTTKNGYIFGEWVVMQGEESITVTDNKFTMPAADVTVTATFTTKKDYYVDEMNDNEQIVMEGQYTVPGLPDVVTPTPTNSCESTHLYFVGWIEGDIGEGQTDMPTGLITAGTENKAASGKTYHAVWAEDANNNQ